MDRALYDVFLFSNELDMLELRLTEHDEAVDKFIIVESTKGFTLLDKPLYYQENKERFKKWEDKIIHLIYDINDTNAWNNEYYARNFAKSKLDEICKPNDIVLSSDLDEIVSINVLKGIKQIGLKCPHSLELLFYYYNCKWVIGTWYLASLSEYRHIVTLQDLRKQLPVSIKDAGWHLSYFMDEENIAKKLSLFSHTEYSGEEYKNRKHVKHCIENGVDLFNRHYNVLRRATQQDSLPKHINLLPDIFQRDYKPINTVPDIVQQDYKPINTVPDIVQRDYKSSKIVGFHQPHLTERGTSIAMFDYAYYNQKILGNKSIIIYQNNHPVTHPEMEKYFRSNFECVTYDTFNQVKDIVDTNKIDVLYSIKYGHRDNPDIPDCLNVNHAVFHVSPHGDRYAAVSNAVASGKTNVVPHMISITPTKDDLRESLNIKNTDIVIGRHGGKDTFGINFVKECIIDLVNSTSNVWFIFMNTDKFYDHPRIIHLDATCVPYEKARFINTCDAMIHASSMGETFGLSVGEFSACNKPILTTTQGDRRQHLDILGDKALIYHDKQSLGSLILSIKRIASSRDDWNAYEDYSPQKVMETFNKVFLS